MEGPTSPQASKGCLMLLPDRSAQLDVNLAALFGEAVTADCCGPKIVADRPLFFCSLKAVQAPKVSNMRNRDPTNPIKLSQYTRRVKCVKIRMSS